MHQSIIIIDLLCREYTCGKHVPCSAGNGQTFSFPMTNLLTEIENSESRNQKNDLKLTPGFENIFSGFIVIGDRLSHIVVPGPSRSHLPGVDPLCCREATIVLVIWNV